MMEREFKTMLLAAYENLDSALLTHSVLDSYAELSEKTRTRININAPLSDLTCEARERYIKYEPTQVDLDQIVASFMGC